jgi:hypothetical protein
MASTSITFDAAVSYVAGTSSLPMSNDTKLEFYGLYKQATEVGGRSKKGGSSRAETPGVLFFHPCVDTPHLHPPPPTSPRPLPFPCAWSTRAAARAPRHLHFGLSREQSGRSLCAPLASAPCGNAWWFANNDKVCGQCADVAVTVVHPLSSSLP